MDRTFFRKAGLISAAEALAKIKGFIVIPILASQFGPSGFGAWTQVSLLVGLLSPVVVLGTDTAAIRFLPGLDRTRQRANFYAWLLFVFTSVLLVAVVLDLSKNVFVTLAFQDPGRVGLVTLTGLTLTTTVLLNAGRVYLRIHNDARAYAWTILSQAVLGLVAVLVTSATSGDVARLVTLTIVADAVLVLVLVGRILLLEGIARPDFSALRQMVGFGLPLIPAAYAVWALNWVDRFFLLRYGDLDDVGVYALGYSLGYLAIQLFVNPIWTMFPSTAAEYFNAGRLAQVQVIYRQSTHLILLLVLPIIAGTTVTGDLIVRMVSTDEFEGASPLIAIVLAGYLFTMLSAYLEIALGLASKQILSSVAVGLALAVNLSLNFLLIPRFLYVGAALATSSAFLVQLIFVTFMAKKLSFLVVDTTYYIRVFTSAIVMALVVEVFRMVVSASDVVELLGSTVLGIASYAFITRSLNLVPDDSYQLIRGLLRRGA